MKEILLIGETGFLGKSLKKELIKKKIQDFWDFKEYVE